MYGGWNDFLRNDFNRGNLMGWMIKRRVGLLVFLIRRFVWFFIFWLGELFWY